jgi:hypothetical protein
MIVAALLSTALVSLACAASILGPGPIIGCHVHQEQDHAHHDEGDHPIEFMVRRHGKTIIQLLDL